MMYDMLVTPTDTPLAIPVPAPIVAIPVNCELHAPPPVALVSAVVAPMHTLSDPAIAAGVMFTVITRVAIQPDGITYDIVDVPAATPVRSPDDASTVATAMLPLLHAPPGMAFASVTSAPTHTEAGPVMAPGVGLTVISALVLQPVGNT